MFFSSIFFQQRERAKREKFPNIGMSEVIKDSAIKLFGRTISLPRNNNNEVSAHDSSSELPVPPEDSSDQNPPSSSSSPRAEVSSTKEHEQAKREKESPRKELTSTQDDEASHQTTEDLKSPTSSSISENPKTPSNEREKPSKDGEQSDTTSVSKSQDKTPKKPDKILPCPRCNSMDTKFCYYNNYNVNQPRHFCKNCQRYWTAGGTMRNVPVGAGRRKNKNSSSSAAHFRQMLLPESLQTPKFNSANGLHLQSGVLAFGSDSPLCDSIASTLSLGEKSPKNGFHTPKLNGFVSCGREDDNNISVGGSSVKASTSSNEESLDKNFQAQSFSSPNWPYPYTWNPSLYQASSYPMPFYPTQAFWGCMPISPPPPPPPSWNLNSISPQSCVSYQNAPNSNPNSPTLGKHSRDGQKDGENTSVLIPKTLRIDDPSEAAKSSIWSTLGIKNEKKGSSLFKAFGSKGDEDEKNHVVLQANPAALSRSLTFHERT